MTKWHLLTMHIIEQALRFGNLSWFSEESFQHAQQLSRHLRDAHKTNRPRVQTIDDIQRIKLQSSYLVRRLMAGIELLRRANGKYLRDLRFCPTRLVEVP